jgi:hypothetical protein
LLEQLQEDRLLVGQRRSHRPLDPFVYELGEGAG